MKLESILLLLKSASIIFKGPRHQQLAHCESYNVATCDKTNKEDCYKQVTCGTISPERHNHCFTLWEHNSVTDVATVQMKGCFLNNKDCYEKTQCTEKNKEGDNQLYFCCCNGEMCNHNITYKNLPFKKPDNFLDHKHDKRDFYALTLLNQLSYFLLELIALCILVALAIIFISWYYHQRKCDKMELSKAELGECRGWPKVPGMDKIPQDLNETLSAQVEPPTMPSAELILQVQSQFGVTDMDMTPFPFTKPLPVPSRKKITPSLDKKLKKRTTLIEKIASGHFCTTWKGQRNSNGDKKTVAVKIYPKRLKRYWSVEVEVFQMPDIDRDNLLPFVAACRIRKRTKLEYWIVTDYCDKGSLCDYLKENTVSWEELLHIAASIARGLKHLHEERRESDGSLGKAIIVHRNLKSKNVLLSGSNPMRVYLADFSQALVVPANKGMLVGQCKRAGTPRYMPPEVLNGAIMFRKDAIVTIDMYSCALVFWELLSRCAIDENPVDEYELPYKVELHKRKVKGEPGLLHMRRLVSRKQMRPQIQPYWREHPLLASFCNTIEDCWDQDVYARIYSSTVLERITSLQSNL